VPAAHVLLRAEAQPVSAVEFEDAGVVEDEKVPGAQAVQTTSEVFVAAAL